MSSTYSVNDGGNDRCWGRGSDISACADDSSGKRVCVGGRTRLAALCGLRLDCLVVRAFQAR